MEILKKEKIVIHSFHMFFQYQRKINISIVVIKHIIIICSDISHSLLMIKYTQKCPLGGIWTWTKWL